MTLVGGKGQPGNFSFESSALDHSATAPPYHEGCCLIKNELILTLDSILFSFGCSNDIRSNFFGWSHFCEPGKHQVFKF